MKKIISISAILLLFTIAAGIGLFWRRMQEPLYKPGTVAGGENLRASLTPPAQSGDSHFWNVETDIKLHHFADGVGVNVLVVHGGPGHPYAQPIRALKPLTAQYRFQYYDQRGCGKSSRPIDRFASSNYYRNMQELDKTLGIGSQIADIERIRRILGDDKLILFGHSFGGFLASLYAAEFPERVKALILIAPAETLAMPAESGGLYESIKLMLPVPMKLKYDAFLGRYLDYGHIFSKNETELAALNSEFSDYYSAAANRKGFDIPRDNISAETGGWMVHAMYLSMGRRHDYRNALVSVKAPVLVVHGENDLQSEKASRLYADAFHNSEFRIVKKAGHFPFNDSPETFAWILSEYLSKLK